VSAESERKEISRDLGDEAVALRRQLFEKSRILEPATISIWKKLILFVVLTSSIAGAVYLLIFREQRRSLLAEATEVWETTHLGRERHIIALPPPPPKEVEPRVRYPDTFDEFDGVLYASSDDSKTAREDETEEEAGFVAPDKTEESEQAFQFLTQNSEIARKLSDNTLPEYELKEWKPVRVDPPVFFIDLLVTRTSDDRELHLIWEVDLDNATTKPLSQAARDLEGQ